MYYFILPTIYFNLLKPIIQTFLIQSLASKDLPVMRADSSDAKYKNIGTISTGVGNVIGSSPGYALALISVLVPPGFTEFTLTLEELNSSARTWVKPSRPNLEAA